MLADQRARLLREDGWDATALSQELYAMFADDKDPLQVGSGIQVDSPLPTVPIIDVGDVPNFDVPFLRGIHNDTPFEVTFTQAGLTPAAIAAPPAAAASPSTTFPGKLIAYLGSNDYTVTIYRNGIANAGTDVTVKQLQGDSTMPHAVDGSVWALVAKNGNRYTMNVATWG